MFSIAGFTNIACKILNLAILEAEKLGYEDINTRHLLYGLTGVKDSISSLILNDYISPFEVESKIKKNDIKTNKKLTANNFTPLVQKILENAKKKARLHGISLAGSEHILLEFLQEEENFGLIVLHEKNISIENLYIKCLSYNFNLHPQFLKQKNINPEISQFGTNLTQLAKSNKLDPLVGRKHELSRIIQILTRRKKNNPCLIGESGVGKTVVVEGLATKIAKGFVPKSLQNKTIFSIDIALMLSGTKYRGDFEKRIKNIILNASKKNNIIFFIDEIHTIIGAGAAEGAIDAANILKPKIEKGEIQIIGSTTIEEYSKYIEKDPALERRFQSVLINEPNKNQTVQILQGIKSKYENFHNVKITTSAIKTAVELSMRYIPDRYLPDKAIDLIDEAASRKKLSYSLKSNFKNDDILKISSKDIFKIISFWTNIPHNQLHTNELERLTKLELTLNQQIFGQKKAISSLVNAIKRNKTGTSNPNRPIGNFLFVGDSGVGKTELCKVLAKTFYGSDKNILKLDMSEYMESNSISKLLGAPPGYVGHNSPNPITNKLKRSPYLVVVFDEIEKAHPDVLNILLQVMDEGVLTDSNNKKINFKNTIIILTSNIYTSSLQKTKTIGFSNSKPNNDSLLSQILKKAFKPEFLTRLDEVILFKNLSKNTLRKIIEKNLYELKERLKKLNYYLEYTKSLTEHILNINNNKNSGARAVQNIIKTKVENLISENILNKKIKKHSKFKISTKKNKIFITSISKKS